MDTGLSFCGRKALPQGRVLPLLNSPRPTQFQAPIYMGWIKGKELGRDRYPREVGEGSQLSNSHSPTTHRGSTSPLLQGLVPEAEGGHLHPQLCFHFTDGRMGGQGRRQPWHQAAEPGRGDQGHSPEGLPPSPSLAAAGGHRMKSGWPPGW